MGIWKSFAGIVDIKITFAAPAEILGDFNNMGIPLFDVVLEDALNFRCKIYRRDYQVLKEFVQDKGGKLTVQSKTGLYWAVQKLYKRPVLVVGMLVLLFFALYLPTRVLFVSVEGNDTISSNKILEEAGLLGIHIGASRREIRSEQVKNRLLAAIPELQWAGINTNGCQAIISVKERSTPTERLADCTIGSIVAKCDGIVQSITVTQGNPVCTVGQAVSAEQVLVSAYTDCGLSIKATRAQAEIRGKTIHEIDIITPTKYSQRNTKTHRQVHYSLRIGKKLINLWKDSGISSTRCVKMYEEKFLTLPGGFALPVCIIKETCDYYSSPTICYDYFADYSWIKQQADQYIISQMVAGKILEKSEIWGQVGEFHSRHFRYICEEMIGLFRSEETGFNHEQRN